MNRDSLIITAQSHAIANSNRLAESKSRPKSAFLPVSTSTTGEICSHGRRPAQHMQKMCCLAHICLLFPLSLSVLILTTFVLKIHDQPLLRSEAYICFETVIRLVIISSSHVRLFPKVIRCQNSLFKMYASSLLFLGAFASSTVAQAVTYSNTSFVGLATVGTVWPISFSRGNGKPVSIGFGNSTYAFQIVGMCFTEFLYPMRAAAN